MAEGRAAGRIRIYGLTNCDTCRKARKWAAEQGLAVDFIDLRDTPPDRATMRGWLAALSPETLINRRSTTWRGLDPESRALADDPASALTLLEAHPTLAKRPIIEANGTVSAGFDAAIRARLSP